MRPALLLTALAAGCATAGSARSTARLTVETTDPAARLYVDDRLTGTAGETRARPLMLAPGRHRVELRVDGNFPAYRLVTLKPGDRASIVVVLYPDPDSAR